MRRLVVILSFLFTAALGAGIVTGFLMLNSYEPELPSNTSQYEIVISDEVNFYTGDENYLLPYLVGTDGSVVKSRFDYVSSSEFVSVSAEGIITVSEVPGEDVFITVSERNTNASKVIKLNIIQTLDAVLGLIAPDGELISGVQNLVMGNTYAITVITKPRGLNIEQYCTIETADTAGAQKDVFDFSFDKDKVLLTVTGLGSGKMTLEVESDSHAQLHKSTISFNISLNEENLADAILSQESKTLLSKQELALINTVYLDESVLDLRELNLLSGLKTVVLTADTVMLPENISDSYCYRVKESLYGDYFRDEKWEQHSGGLIPYSQGAEEVYIVYHSTKSTELSFAKITSAYSLITLIATGYINTGWRDSNGEAVDNALVRAVSQNGIHVYAQWAPIGYTVEYNVRAGEGAVYSEQWTYETCKVLKDISQSNALTGYKFVGWTNNQDAGMYSGNAYYFTNTEYKEFTETDGAVIKLYDVWAPIEYTLKFDMTGATAISDVKLKYGQDYTMPTGVKTGNDFIRWTYRDADDAEHLLDAGATVKNLTATDGGTITVSPKWEEKIYTLHFVLSDGLPEIPDVELSYTAPYTLKKVEKAGFPKYSWYYDANNNGSVDGTETQFAPESTITISQIASIGNATVITLKVAWRELEYTTYFDARTGNSSDNRTSKHDYMDIFYFPPITRTGFTLVSWTRKDTSETFTDLNMPLQKLTNIDGLLITFEANWREHTYSITFNNNGGSQTNEISNVRYTQIVALPSAPTRTGYTFTSWSYNSNTYNPLSQVSRLTAADNGRVVMSANWSVIYYSLTLTQGTGTTLTVRVNGAVVSNGTHQVAYGSSISVTCAVDSGYQNLKCTNSDITSMPASDVSITSSAEKTPSTSCVVKGTEIMLAGGETAKVETLRPGDVILAFDHSTGNFVPSRIAYTFYMYETVGITTLGFTGAVELKIANSHGLFDVTLNKYVEISADNVQNYIGHEFVYVKYAGGEPVKTVITLLSYAVEKILIERYDVATENHFNHIANGLLACPDSIVGVCNMFDFTNGQIYDTQQMYADILEFGLYAYEEWSDYVTLEEFNSFNGAYFKIAIGKGLLTFEEIFNLISYLQTTWIQ